MFPRAFQEREKAEEQTMGTTKDSKRILSVKVERIDDPDGDPSWLGEFADDPKDYAIVHRGEHAGTFVD